MGTPISRDASRDMSRDGHRRSAVAEWLLIVAMTTVTWLPEVCCVLALLGLAAVWQRSAPLVVVVLAGAVRGFGRRDPLPGRAVRPGDEPELAALVEDVAGRLGFRSPLLVRVVPEPEAWLAPWRVSGVRAYVLVLGLPLLRMMTAAQLAAVIAHELAHEQHVRDHRTAWLQRARTALTDQLDRRFRPLAPLAAPLLRASQPLVWEPEFAADADAARVAGSAAVRDALELTGLLEAACDALGDRWVSDLAADHAYPRDYYDALAAALGDPLVARRSALIAAEADALDPYAAADHPPVGRRVAALPDGDGSPRYGNEPIALGDAASVEQWCVAQLAGLDRRDDTGTSTAGGSNGGGNRKRGEDGRRSGEDGALQPLRILGLDPERLLRAADDESLPLLLGATRRDSPAAALAAAVDAIADGSWPRLARRIAPELRWAPRSVRRFAARDALTGVMAGVLVPLLRDAGWEFAGRWLRSVLVAPDGTVVDLYDTLTSAVDDGDPAPVRALLKAAAGRDTTA